MPVNEANETAKATRAGWLTTDLLFTTVRVAAPLSGSGVVCYVLMSVGWICETCGERVTVSRFAEHARKAH